MTESLTSLCRTLTSEGGYQLRNPYRRVEYIGRIGQGRAQDTRPGRDTGTQGQAGPRGEVEEEEEEGDEVENEGNQWKRQEEEEEAVGGFNVQVSTVSTLGIEFLLKGSSPRP